MLHSRLVRWSLVAAFIFCGGAFGTAILLSQRSAAELEDVLTQISANADPSVDHLTAAVAITEGLHRRLLHLRIALATGRPLEFDATAVVANFEREMAFAEATPDFPGEKELHDAVVPSVDRMKALTLRVQAAVRAKDHTLAATLIDDEVPAVFSDATTGLQKLMRLNLAYGHLAAAHGEDVRLASRRLAYALGATAALVTAGVALFLFTLMTRLARADARWASQTEERSKEMELFAARVAHDIRSPLGAALLTCAHATRIDGTPEKLVGMLRRIESGLRNTSVLVDGLYEFARAGGESSSRQATSLDEVVGHLLDDLGATAKTAGVSLSTEAIPECRVAASPGVVSSILLNLLNNAIRYAGKGTRVTVRAHDGDTVRVEVEDTGPGIPEEAQQRIFRPFTREEGARGEGLGLGLATVRRLVEAHGGACGVHPRLGGGSIFWFTLPRARPDETWTGRTLRPVP